MIDPIYYIYVNIYKYEDNFILIKNRRNFSYAKGLC